MTKFVKFVLLFITSLVFISGKAYACDTCSGRNVGETWTCGTNVCECNSCGGDCNDPNTGEIRSDACPQDGNTTCDLTCVGVEHKYTKIISTCSTPSCSGVSISPSSPLPNQNVTFTVTGVSNANSGTIKVWSSLEGESNGDDYTLNPYWSVVNLSNHPTSTVLPTVNVRATVRNSCGNSGTCSGTFTTNHDVPSAYISAVPSTAVIHFGDATPDVTVSSTGTDEGEDLGYMTLYRRNCTSTPCTAWQAIGASFDFSARKTNTVSRTLEMTVSDMGVHNLVVNAADRVDPIYRCIGNPDIASFPHTVAGGIVYYDCDSTPGDGTTDSISVNVRAAPTATMAASVLTVAPGSAVSFTPTAHDLEGNLNRMAVYRRLCTDASCTTVGAWSLASSVGCDFTFPATTSRTLSGCSWTPGVGDIGTWQVAVNAYDNNSPVLSCSGDPDITYPSGNWYDCGNADHVTLTVRNTSQISGKVVEVDGSCPANLSDIVGLDDLSPLHFDTRVRWYSTSTQYTSSPITPTDGDYIIDTLIVDPIPLLTVGLINSPTQPDMDLVPVCAYNSPTGITFSPNRPMSGFTPNTLPFNIVDKEEIYMAYDWDNLVKGGWITLLDGDIYSNDASVVAETVPTSPLGGYLGYLMQQNKPSGFEYPFYAFSEQNISVKTPSGIDRIVTDVDSDGDEDGGWVSEVNGEFGVDGYDPQIPGTPQMVDNLINLPNHKTVGMNTSNFYNLFSGGGTTVLYTVVDGGTAVVRINGDITISKNIVPLPLSGGGRLLLIVDGDVNIASGVGYDSPSTLDTPNIEAFILASGNINILSTDDESTEVTLTVKGSLVSTGGSVNMNRNLGDRNIQYPALVVDYDPGYIYTLTMQERQSDGVQYPGLFVTDVEWEEEQ